jgi:aminopeptidase N
MSERASAIFQYYASLVGEAPYPSFTVALTESRTPGGHSPPYFAVLNQSPPATAFTWRNDPVAFDNYPSFFIAHEIAHQWWGQAVGWKNYHEQWISEGFAQYFAALYASKERGDGLFESIMRQMRDTAIDASGQGPVYLGYRLGHLKSDGRVFRSVVYNKGAVVLQMLRHLVGDEAFFGGLQQFYRTWAYKKAGTDDFRQAMEKASGRDLSRFFDSFIYGAEIPRVKFSRRLMGDGTMLVRFEHRNDVTDLPITVRVNYADGTSEDLVVPVSERVVERTIHLKATLRSVDVNQDGAALAVIEK